MIEIMLIKSIFASQYMFMNSLLKQLNACLCITVFKLTNTTVKLLTVSYSQKGVCDKLFPYSDLVKINWYLFFLLKMGMWN